MSFAVVSAAVLALIAAPFFGRPSHPPHAPHRTRAAFAQRIGGWTLRVHRDPFAGTQACSLTRGRASYEQGTVVFRLSSRTDSAAAVYRIDSGPPTPVVADQMAIAKLDLPVWQDDLANPSGGMVRIPAAKLAGASLVRIEARRGGRVWRVRIDDLGPALQEAAKAGCAA
jgi:hypothetical protein